MKTLSINTISAYEIVLGLKKYENRTWKTNHRGTILIHSLIVSDIGVAGDLFFKKKSKIMMILKKIFLTIIKIMKNL